MLIGITGSGGGHKRIAMCLVAKQNVGTILYPLAREERPASTSKLQNHNRSCSYTRMLYRRSLPQIEVNPRTGIVSIESITPLDDNWRERRWMIVRGKRVPYYTYKSNRNRR